MAIDCEVESDYDVGRIVGRCRGTYGCSGTGFVDRDGILICLYAGAVRGEAMDWAEMFDPHELGSLRLSELWDWISEACEPTRSVGVSTTATGPNVVDPDCLTAMDRASQLTAMNPSALLMPAHFLHELHRQHAASGNQSIIF
jgi:hypothetical protein